MKQLILAFFCIVLSSAALSARSQVEPSATARTLTVKAGGFGSVFQPDYAGNGIAQTSPNRLYGVGAYVDARFTRWLEIEDSTRRMSLPDRVFGMSGTIYTFFGRANLPM